LINKCSTANPENTLCRIFRSLASDVVSNRNCAEDHYMPDLVLIDPEVVD